MTVLAEHPIAAIPDVPEPLTVDLNMYEEFAGRKRFTREECEFFERVGILDVRYELLDGEIILKVGQNLPHSVTVSRITFYLMGIWGPNQVFVQTTMEVRRADQVSNRPEPDVYVLDRPASEFRQMPQGNETLLAVEVADSTLRSDLLKKSPLYARAGVPEFWVIDVNGRVLYVHREPMDGVYATVIALKDDESIAPLSAPDKAVRVADLLPPTAPASL